MVSQRVWLSVWLRCTGGHHPLLLFGGAPPLSFLTVTSLKSMSPVQQRLPLRVSLRWDACATSRIAFTEQAVCPQANVSNADSYKKLTDAHPSVTVRAYPELGGVLQKWSGRCMLYRPLLPVAYRMVSCKGCHTFSQRTAALTPCPVALSACFATLFF